MNKVLKIAKVQFIMRSSSKIWLFAIFIQPILFLLISFYIMDESTRQIYNMYIIIGSGMMGTWSSVLFSSGSDIDRERKWGTLEMIVGCPTPLSTIVMGKALANSFSGLFSMILAFIISVLFFKQNVIIMYPFLFIIILIMTIISVAAAGMLICTLFTLSRSASGLMNMMENPIFILSGVMFPITILPLWTKPISYLLSLTWGMDALRMTSMGISSYNKLYVSLFMLIICTFIYFLLSIWLFKKVESKARKESYLGVY